MDGRRSSPARLTVGPRDAADELLLLGPRYGELPPGGPHLTGPAVPGPLGANAWLQELEIDGSPFRRVPAWVICPGLESRASRRLCPHPGSCVLIKIGHTVCIPRFTRSQAGLPPRAESGWQPPVNPGHQVKPARLRREQRRRRSPARLVVGLGAPPGPAQPVRVPAAENRRSESSPAGVESLGYSSAGAAACIRSDSSDPLLPSVQPIVLRKDSR